MGQGKFMIREIRALTGLRGIAALCVAAYHFSNSFTKLNKGELVHISSGYMAVDLFFILSGFVLAYNYRPKFANGFSARDYRDFMIKRIARIYPAYIGISALLAAKAALGSSEVPVVANFKAWDWIGNLLMLTGWGLDFKPILGVSWSASAELACYILFPLFVLYVLPFKSRTVLAVIIGVIGVALIGTWGPGVNGALDVVSFNTQWSLARAFCGFTLGMCIYSLYTANRSAIDRFGDPLFVIGLLLLVVTCLPFFEAFAGRSADFYRYPPLALIMIGSATDRPIGLAILGNRIVHYLGLISYSIYLCHIPLISPVLKLHGKLEKLIGAAAGWAALALFLLVITGAAAIFYPLLEKGGKNLLLRLLLTKRPARADTDKVYG